MVINNPAPTSSRRERNKARTRDQLRSAAWHLFRTRGYEATSIEDIASRADTAKATFFNYYPTKEHVLAEFHGAAARQILAVHRRRSYTSAPRALTALANVAARVMEREPQLTAAIVRNLWGSPVLAQTDRSIGKAFSDVVQNILREGKRTGEIGDHVNISTAVALVLSVLNGTVLDWVMAVPRFSLPVAMTTRMKLLVVAFER